MKKILICLSLSTFLFASHVSAQNFGITIDSVNYISQGAYKALHVEVSSYLQNVGTDDSSHIVGLLAHNTPVNTGEFFPQFITHEPGAFIDSWDYPLDISDTGYYYVIMTGYHTQPYVELRDTFNIYVAPPVVNDVTDISARSQSLKDFVGAEKIMLYDMQGKLVSSGKISNSGFIPDHQMVSGFYILVAIKGKNILRQQIALSFH